MRLKRALFAGFAALARALAPAFADPLVPTNPAGAAGGGGVTVGAGITGTCPNGDVLFSNSGAIACEVVSGTGTVTGVSWAGGLIAVSNPTTTPAFTVAGTSGGVPYFSSASTWASSGLLSANALMIGGGAGTAPSTTTTGAGVLTALGAAINASTGLPNVDGAITTGDCLMWGPGVQDAGAACGSGGSSLPAFGMPPYTTGKSIFYRNPLDIAPAFTGNVGAANEYMCGPWWLTQTLTVKALAIRVIGTSTGNGSVALQGALFNDLINTSGFHRPGTLIDYADGGGGFATGAAATVTSTMHNTTDTITIASPGLIWFCVQKFDGTATFAAISNTGNIIGALIGSATPANLIGTTMIDGVFIAGTAFGGANWVNWTTSTVFTEASGQGLGASGLLEIN